MLKRICLVAGMLVCVFGLAVNLTYAGKPVIGVLDGKDIGLWKKSFAKEYSIQTVKKEDMAEELKKVDILAIGDVPVTRQQALVIEKSVDKGLKIIAYGKAGYSDGKFNLTRALRVGKYMFSLPLMYPCYTVEDDFVPLAKTLLKNGADGINVHTYSYVKGNKMKGQHYKGEKPEYAHYFKNIIFPNMNKWIKDDVVLPYGLPQYPKSVWLTCWNAMIKNGRDYYYATLAEQQPEAVVKYLKDLGFNIISFCTVRHSYITWQSKKYPNMPLWKLEKRIPSDYTDRLIAACKKEGMQIWGDIINASYPYCRKHPEHKVQYMTGKMQNQMPSPMLASEYYKQQREIVRELLIKYPYINGIEIDEPFFAFGEPASRKKFEEETGKKAERHDPVFTAWREDQHIKLYFKPLAEVIKSVRPACSISLAMPPSDASLQSSSINLSKYADAGLNIWVPELSRGKKISREARRVINAERSMVYHTPQEFIFNQLYFCGTERDTESIYRDITFACAGIQTNMFAGAEPMYWMKGKDGVMWPGVVQANKGRTAYFSFNPFSNYNVVKLLENTLRKMISGKKDSGKVTFQSGWPVDTKERIYASLILKDVDKKKGLEVISIGHANNVRVYNNQGQMLPGWPVKMEGFATGSSPACADIDGNGSIEIVTAGQEKVYVWKIDGKLLKGWPKEVGGDIRGGTPVLADINKDRKSEIIVGCGDGKVYIWNVKGKPLKGWPFKADEAISASIAVGDLNGNGKNEIIAATEGGTVYVLDKNAKILPGFPVSADCAFYSSPAIGDIDNDGRLEIVIGGGDRKVHAWHTDGTLVKGWPQRTGDVVLSSPALADLDGDGKLEVIVGSKDAKLHIWKSNGEIYPGWPQTTGLNIESSPAVADINGDGKSEIIVGSWDKGLYVWDKNGSLIEGWPKKLTWYIYSSPAVGDIDGDGDIEIAIGCDDGNIYIWDLPGKYNPKNCPWPMFRQNAGRTGCIKN